MKLGRSRLKRSETDATRVRERLATAMQAVETAIRVLPEVGKGLMDERARILALPLAAAPDAGERIEVATFSLGRERYGIETRHIQQVIRLIDFTPVPGTPDFLLGVTNLRGEMLAIIDLRRFLGIAAPGVTDLSRVLVLGQERPEFGLLADAADQVTLLGRAEILEPPQTVAGIAREYLLGVTEDALIVLDGEALLRDERLFIEMEEESGDASQ